MGVVCKACGVEKEESGYYSSSWDTAQRGKYYARLVRCKECFKKYKRDMYRKSKSGKVRKWTRKHISA